MNVPCDGSWQEKNQQRQFARYVAPSTQDAPRISKIWKLVQKKENCDTFDEAVAEDEDDTEEVDPFWSPLDAFSKGIVLEQTLIFMLPEYATEPKYF